MQKEAQTFYQRSLELSRGKSSQNPALRPVAQGAAVPAYSGHANGNCFPKDWELLSINSTA